jgi:lysozyme
MAASAIMTPFGIAALKSREGARLRAYLDSQGVPTIGYGHIKGVRLGQSITMAQADAFFLEDLASHALPILSCIKVPIADHERDALISIAFNIGVGGFQGSTFLRLLNAGDRAGCAKAIMAWTKNKELISRRTAERDQFLTPYTKAAPRARSTDARPVEPDVYVIAPAVPTVPVQTKPLPPPDTDAAGRVIGITPALPPGPRPTDHIPALPVAPSPAPKPGWLASILANLRTNLPPKKDA